MFGHKDGGVTDRSEDCIDDEDSCPGFESWNQRVENLEAVFVGPVVWKTLSVHQLDLLVSKDTHETEIPTGNYSYDGHTCCGVSESSPYNAPVVEAPCSWVINNTVNVGYAANWYADASKPNPLRTIQNIQFLI